MQSLWQYNVFNGQTSLFGKIKLKGCVFRQQLPVTLYYKANCYSHQTNLENKDYTLSQNRWHNLSFNSPSIWFIFTITDSQRHPCSPQLCLWKKKKTLLLNWFALCHCHKYVFPVLTGSCNSISSPSTSLRNRSVLGWLGLLKLADLLLLHVFRKREHVHAHKWAKESRGGRGRGRGKETLLCHQTLLWTTEYKVSKQCLKQNHFEPHGWLSLWQVSSVTFRQQPSWGDCWCQQYKWLSISLIHLSCCLMYKQEQLSHLRCPRCQPTSCLPSFALKCHISR